MITPPVARRVLERSVGKFVTPVTQGAMITPVEFVNIRIANEVVAVVTASPVDAPHCDLAEAI